MKYFVGIDCGSTNVKVCYIDENKEIKKLEIIKNGLAKIEEVGEYLQGVKDEHHLVTLTGYGRYLFDVDYRITEILAHAKGSYYLNDSIKTIVDIGGQDAKVIRVNKDGKVIDFRMNEKCAAGTGCFFDKQMEALNINKDDIWELYNGSENPVQLKTTCSVFVTSEIISLQSQNAKTEDIIKGVCFSIAKKIKSLGLSIGFEDNVFFTGGLASNHALKDSLESVLEMKVYNHKDAIFAGAIGAALHAYEQEDCQNEEEDAS